MKKILHTLICIMSINMANAQWTTANLSVARTSLSATAIGTKAFFAGGYGSAYSSKVDIYDNSTSLWTTANLSVARRNLSATSVGTKAFFAGGTSASFPPASPTFYSIVDIYDNSTGLWTTANLSVPRYNLSAATVGTKAFFAGGSIGTSSRTSVVDIYDNSTGLWTTANLSAARSNLSATTVGTKVFFAGGIDSSSWSSVVDIYDNSTGLWTTANLSVARTNLSATAVGTKAFFAGGLIGPSTNPTYYSVVDIYDNSTGLWTTANLSVARSGLSATADGTKVFFAGGSIGSSITTPTYFSVVDIYDNSTGLWTTDSLSVARAYLSATAVGTKVFFAGGTYSSGSTGSSSVVDIYDNTIPTGINAINNSEGFKIYPNPATNQLTIDNDPDLIGMKIERVAIYDASGRKVYSENLGTSNANPEITIDVSKFSAGVYLVKVQSADFIATKKLVVEK